MHRIHYKILLWSRPNKDGLRTVMLRVTYMRQPRYFSLGRYCGPEEWDGAAGRFRSNHPNYRAENALMLTIEGRMEAIAYRHEKENAPLDWAAFEAEMFAAGPTRQEQKVKDLREQIALEEYLPVYLQWAKTKGGKKGQGVRLGTLLTYETAAHNFARFRPGWPMAKMAPEVMRDFEKWLEGEAVGEGSRKLYSQKIKTMLARAHGDGVIGSDGLAKHSLAHLSNKAGHKRAITEADMALLEGAKVEPALEFWRDLFLLSYYLRGMNLADLADLTSEQIAGGRLEYGRRKSGTFYSVKLSSKAEAILARYGQGGQGRVLPILKECHVTEEQRRHRIINVTTMANKALRAIAGQVGLSVQGRRLSFYSARHSYATHHENAGTNIRKIQKLLGHSSLTITERYLRDHTTPELDAADEGLLGV